jgi:hypothetical protein
MDWRQLPEVLAVGKEIYGSFESLCVWTKSDANKAASGCLYRPQHELICVFKAGEGASINHGGRRSRPRTDVWDYGSHSGLPATSEPVAMIADAIRDCSNRGDVILEPFGCGAVLMAAEQTRRCARLIEVDPTLVDLTIKCWQRLTGDTARNAESGLPFVGNHNAA